MNFFVYADTTPLGLSVTVALLMALCGKVSQMLIFTF